MNGIEATYISSGRMAENEASAIAGTWVDENCTKYVTVVVLYLSSCDKNARHEP